MNGFTKLFSNIVTSTIWQENNQTRIVWITLLALADKNGKVNATVPGLANIAKVTISECEAAIEKFLSPDKYSRSQEHEGRRIEVVEGGWRLLNYDKYRAIGRGEDRKEYLLGKKREERERKRQQPSTDVNKSPQGQPIAEAEADKRKEIYKEKNSVELRLAQLLLEEIRKRKPDFKQPNLRKWSVHIDRMIRLDKRKPERIEAIIKWCQADAPKGENGFSWQDNILSTAKLREKFDRLELTMNKSSPGRKLRNFDSTGPSQEYLIEQLEKLLQIPECELTAKDREEIRRLQELCNSRNTTQ